MAEPILMVAGPPPSERVVVFGDEERSHYLYPVLTAYSTPASFFSFSSSTERPVGVLVGATLPAALRIAEVVIGAMNIP
ncbi:hypothetical protein NKJ50_32705 [Mesorhizobium sp. M0115]|uniref:hypothetical protein n=1 Tax=Mesorhizobium sp. M0115 TaxID=2956883 RepID=UPI003339A915